MSRRWKVPYKYDGEERYTIVDTRFPWEVKGLAERLLRVDGIVPVFAEGYRDIQELKDGEE